LPNKSDSQNESASTWTILVVRKDEVQSALDLGAETTEDKNVVNRGERPQNLGAKHYQTSQTG
jgi:hypothetical protein